MLPKRMVIVGGGYIAVEFAGIFSGFGVEVTEIIRANNILRGFDSTMRTALFEEMEKRNIKIRIKTEVRAIEKRGAIFSLQLDNDEVIETDCVMYATGRKALRPVAYITQSVSITSSLSNCKEKIAPRFSIARTSVLIRILIFRFSISSKSAVRIVLSKPRRILFARIISVTSTPNPEKMPANSTAM